MPVPERSETLNYFASFGGGFLVGALYTTVRLPSPAPPLTALAGLFAMGTSYSLLEMLV
ncbi:DUF1427 family protein [Streptomyces puniciscabiei]